MLYTLISMVLLGQSNILAEINQTRAQLHRPSFVWDARCAWVAQEAVRNGFEYHEYFPQRIQRAGLNLDQSAEGSFPLNGKPIQAIFDRFLQNPNAPHARHFFDPRFIRFGAAYSSKGQDGPFIIFVYSQ